MNERKVYSQNGEDGIIEEIFDRIGEGSKRFVEISPGDGTECNTRFLTTKGWTGIWVDGDPANLAAWNQWAPAIDARQEFVDRDTIYSTLGNAPVPDLLSVDIDGQDYYVLEQLLRKGYDPRVVVVEYNSSRGLTDWVVPYDPAFRGVYRTDWFGATLAALVRMMGFWGYTCIGCDSTGVNAFFLRNDQATAFYYRPLDPRHGGVTHCESDPR